MQHASQLHPVNLQSPAGLVLPSYDVGEILRTDHKFRAALTSTIATPEETAYANSSPAKRSAAPALFLLTGPGKKPNTSTAAVVIFTNSDYLC